MTSNKTASSQPFNKLTQTKKANQCSNRSIRTFKNLRYDIFSNAELTPNNVDHSLIREKAKTRVFDLLLKDELIQMEKEKEMKILLKQKEEEKQLKMIQDRAIELRNSNTNEKYKQYANQIILTRLKLDNSMKTKRIIQLSSTRNTHASNNKAIDISQRNKIDLSSDLIRTIKDKSNFTSTSAIKENDKGLSNNLNNNSNSNSTNKTPTALMPSYLSKIEEANISLKDSRVKDLSVFLSNFNIDTNDNAK